MLWSFEGFGIVKILYKHFSEKKCILLTVILFTLDYPIHYGWCGNLQIGCMVQAMSKIYSSWAQAHDENFSAINP